MPATQTPRPPRPPPQQDPKKNPLGFIISKWSDFTTQCENGTMSPSNAKSIRGIIGAHPRAAIVQGFMLLKTNIFVNMNTLLDPRVEHGGPPALNTERYVKELAAAMEELKAISMKRTAGSQGGSSTGTGTATSQQASSPAATQSGGASPNPTATASPRPVVSTNPTAANPASQVSARPPIRPQPPPAGMMSLPDVRQILANPEPGRQALFERSPGLKERFNAALTYWHAVTASNRAAATAAAGGVRPSTPAPSSGPSTPSSSQNQPTQQAATNQTQARPPAQTPARPPPNNNPHAGTPTPNPNPAAGMPNRPFNLNLPPQRQASPMSPQQPPVENERARRKRKLKEYVREEAPGLEIEVGVDQIVSDYLDAFIDEAARGAIRLAKHRKAAKVELKDMALFLDVTHDVRLPGFNVQLPHRQHISADTERKRGKAVAPRAARKGKEAD